MSPLLANIALNGIESIHKYHKMPNRRITDKTPKESITEPSIRYADDMVIILRPQDDDQDEQTRKLRTSGAGCGESCTPGSNREGQGIISLLDSTN